LTPDDILALEYRPDPSKQKIAPLSRGYHTHVTRFKAMYFYLQRTPGWTDLDIFKITYDEYMAFSRRYMAGQVASIPLSPAPHAYASSTDPVALFMKSIKWEPKDFPVIKSLNQWDSVKRAVTATATIQSIVEVLDHTYVPPAGDKPLFDLKNSYWYKGLVDIIQESSLRAHLRKVYQGSSWEGGTPAVLDHIPADNEIKRLYEIYTDRPVAPSKPSDSSTRSLFDEYE
jgi:hypothetical protein